MVSRIAALNPPGLAAGVSYYGAQIPADQVPRIQTPLMLHYASLDDRINAGIAAYRTALEANGKSFEIHMYEGANHAFNNDTNPARFNADAAKLAFERTVAFFRRHLA
jgi:carboxymethylenebutenolidase